MNGEIILQMGDEFADEFVDDNGVRLTFRSFHHWPLQRVEGLFVAGFELGDGFGGGGQREDFANEGFDFAGVVGLGEAARGDDGVGGLAGGEHFGEDDFLRLLLRQGSRVDNRNQSGDMSRCDFRGERSKGDR